MAQGFEAAWPRILELIEDSERSRRALHRDIFRSKDLVSAKITHLICTRHILLYIPGTALRNPLPIPQPIDASGGPTGGAAAGRSGRSGGSGGGGDRRAARNAAACDRVGPDRRLGTGSGPDAAVDDARGGTGGGSAADGGANGCNGGRGTDATGAARDRWRSATQSLGQSGDAAARCAGAEATGTDPTISDAARHARGIDSDAARADPG